MKQQIEREFTRIGKLVQASSVPDEDKQMALTCLTKLGALCETFLQTYESRDADEMARVEKGLLYRLAEPSPANPVASGLAKVLSARLRDVHERLGLPPFIPAKPRPEPRARSGSTA